MITHNDFGGRASWGYNAVSGSSNTDRNGHGTHVSGTIAGTTYGIAKKANLVAVKVLGDDGSGTNAGVIAGINWVTANASGKRAGLCSTFSTSFHNKADSMKLPT